MVLLACQLNSRMSFGQSCQWFITWNLQQKGQLFPTRLVFPMTLVSISLAETQEQQPK